MQGIEIELAQGMGDDAGFVPSFGTHGATSHAVKPMPQIQVRQHFFRYLRGFHRCDEQVVAGRSQAWQDIPDIVVDKGTSLVEAVIVLTI